MPDSKPRKPRTLLTRDDLYLFNEGTHHRLYDRLGAHVRTVAGVTGTSFAVWAPNAASVSVIGDFNEWDEKEHPLGTVGGSGIWDGFLPGVGPGSRYKYRITSRNNGYRVDKADPFGFRHEVPPATASIVADLGYEWQDAEWMHRRREHNALTAPLSIYELHLGSWRRREGRVLSYREIAEPLADYVLQLGFTHVELLPIMEHPFYGSWGYQTTGYFAPTSRYGEPQDFMYLVDHLHQRGIGVILDWVPSHFPGDQHGLHYFDGTSLFEHADPRQGFHPDWSSWIFNYGRHEVRSFLLSSGLFWLDRYHADGLRVDAVASMLYLDYSRGPGEWIPNEYGGRENLEAIQFLRRFNADVYQQHPDVQTMAEESTAWPMVSRPNYIGGLGFGMKWDMGWMHDSLDYFGRDPIYRRYHHGRLTFRGIYAFTENFVMPLSHDEVVHGKGSLLGRMPGDDWQKFANLRLLLGYMFTLPGKKLLFMGGEFGQWREWNHDAELQWELLEHASHRGLQRWVSDLNAFYRAERATHGTDFDPAGFEWIDADDALNSVLSYVRRAPGGTAEGDSDELTIILNATPLVRPNYRIGVPHAGYWQEVLNSDAAIYGGSGVGNLGGVHSTPIPYHGRMHSLNLTLPPLSVLVLRRGTEEPA
ncbi:MAG TPA: 1,4-alpha-glucan branching protein GlgB [Longimicrobiales bacterium]|nr:1,4-alpha-glucan branching protein GlgB [Longimicrobiales bacterium]